MPAKKLLYYAVVIAKRLLNHKFNICYPSTDNVLGLLGAATLKRKHSRILHVMFLRLPDNYAP